jgi:hypothetical protein
MNTFQILTSKFRFDLMHWNVSIDPEKWPIFGRFLTLFPLIRPARREKNTSNMAATSWMTSRASPLYQPHWSNTVELRGHDFPGQGNNFPGQGKYSMTIQSLEFTSAQSSRVLVCQPLGWGFESHSDLGVFFRYTGNVSCPSFPEPSVVQAETRHW